MLATKWMSAPIIRKYNEISPFNHHTFLHTSELHATLNIYIRDKVARPMVMRVGSFFPFQSTYYLNGHSFIERELLRLNIPFRKDDNAFVAVENPKALQAAADRLSPEMIRKHLEYWTLVLGPKFSRREREEMSLSRFYALNQVEYCRNLFESCPRSIAQFTPQQRQQVSGKYLSPIRV
jgi:hypothetical protein